MSAHRAEQQEEDQPVGMAVLRVLSGRTQGVSTGSARPATHWLGAAVRWPGRGSQMARMSAHMRPVCGCHVGLPCKRDQAEGNEEHPDPRADHAEGLVDCESGQARGRVSALRNGVMRTGHAELSVGGGGCGLAHRPAYHRRRSR